MSVYKFMSMNMLTDVLYNYGDSRFKCRDEAIHEMLRQRGKREYRNDGMMERGVIVRHLALPGCGEDSRDILDYLHGTYGDQIFISLMNQYTPMPQVMNDPNLGRKLTSKEYDELVDYAISIGITNGFIQDGETASQSYIPAFDGTGL